MCNLYEYSCWVHRKTGTNDFSLVLSREPPGPMVVIPSSTLEEQENRTQILRQLNSKVVNKMTLMTARAD